MSWSVLKVTHNDGAISKFANNISAKFEHSARQTCL